ncbi:MAG: tRNA1(Val) (adenine(37)-N6)-methyltransferase [Eubacterium sp.]|nr:tRNA1(Val) (adenine(37)-N6)-methyltransferase [Eubacterium sp.]
MEWKPGERLDDLQIKGYKIWQKTDGFCFGMDAVLLSDYARVKRDARVMDLCSGSGIVAILLEAKYPLESVTALEYQEAYVEMARRSLQMNGQEGKIRMVQGDVREVRDRYPQDSFDYVTCNPPYMTGNHGKTNEGYEKAISRHEILCSLEDVVRASAWLLKHGGHLVLVHRPFRLAEIIGTLKKYKLEPKRMRLVYPYVDKEPNMVLIDAVKGGRQRITVDPPLIVYQKDGTYTDEIYRIYGMEKDKDGEGL